MSQNSQLVRFVNHRAKNRISLQHIAAQSNQQFSEDDLNLNVPDEEKNTLLHTAAKHNATISIESLLKIPPSALEINRTNIFGDTPLHLAVKFNHLEAAQALLRGNPDLNSQNKQGDTPLGIIDEQGNTIFHTAAKHNSVISIESLLKIPHGVSGINCANISGDTPLHLAVKFNRLGAVQALLKGNPDLNIQNKQGKTPMDIVNMSDLKSKGSMARLLTSYLS